LIGSFGWGISTSVDTRAANRPRYHKCRPHRGAGGNSLLVSVISIVLITATVLIAPMLTLMLTGNLVIRLGVFVSQFVVKLTMFPRTNSLVMRVGMLLVELAVNVIMMISQMLVLVFLIGPLILRHRGDREGQQRSSAYSCKNYVTHHILLADHTGFKIALLNQT
jgi:hypothetical protein